MSFVVNFSYKYGKKRIFMFEIEEFFLGGLGLLKSYVLSFVDVRYYVLVISVL